MKAFELAFLALLLYVPPIAAVFGTAPLSWELLILLPFPIIVWGIDALVRRGRGRSASAPQDDVSLPNPV